MFSGNRLREAENISSIRKNPLLNSERKGLTRLKSNALGDVRNTIHSRPGNGGTSNTLKSLAQGKVSVSSPRLQDENSVAGKSSGQAKCEKLIKSAVSGSLCYDPAVHETDIFDTHYHYLCEQAEQTGVIDLFLHYKLSNAQIENLVKSFKQINVSGFKVPTVVPCTDIEIPKEGTNTRCKGRIFSVKDIFRDLVLTDVPAPARIISSSS